MEPAGLTRLGVGDENFLVSSLIERCPRVMMLRELVRNALEAAATAPEGERWVEIDAVPVHGTPKLRICNAGRGMDADELFRMADLAASVRKQHGLDRNFGMGAKVASLPSNRLGLRYRSRHAGAVHETLLGWRDGAYGRLRQRGRDGGWHDVLPVAGEEADAMPATDWTEVVLFGNAALQDTSLDPYHGDPPMPPDWLFQALSARFFRIDDAVRLSHEGALFEPLCLRLPRLAARYETVVLPDGIRLHYAHCPPDRSRTLFAGAGLVHRGEFYDLRCDQHWLHMAPVFGIPFAAGCVLLIVELPDEHAAVPDGYRQFLRHPDGQQDAIGVRDFATLLHAHRPGWLRAIVAAAAPGAAVSEGVYGELRHLLRTLGVRRRSRLVGNGRIEPASIAVAGDNDAAVPAGEGFEPEPVPEILLLRLPEDILARGLTSRAARYYPESHQLFLNGAYAAVVEMRETLETSFAWHPDAGRVRALAFAAAEQAMAARVGRMLVFALARQEDWPVEDVAQALSPHALSLAADDWRPSLGETLAEMGRALEATPASEETSPAAVSASRLAAAAG